MAAVSSNWSDRQRQFAAPALLSLAAFCQSNLTSAWHERNARGAKAMAIIMFDLAGEDPALRFSPYCWRIRMALAHKGLEVETIPWRFTEKDVIAFSGQGRVPVIRDGDRVVSDSWAIAEYLEDTYPDRPSLFGGVGGRAHARFVNAWADGVLLPGIARLIVRDLLNIVDSKDRHYFRESREARFKMTLEAVQEGREARLSEFQASLLPMRSVLGKQPWLGGAAPSYADHTVFGTLQWPRCASRFELLAAEDPVADWRSRMLDLFGGLGRGAVTV
jgi:glutathione S-transferase